MAEAADRTIWFGGQYEGGETDTVNLVGTHRLGGDASLLSAPADAYAGMRQYVGAVTVNDAGTRVAATSPVGGHVVIFDAATRGFVESRTIADAAWSYEEPVEGAARIGNHIAFYANEDVTVERI